MRLERRRKGAWPALAAGMGFAAIVGVLVTLTPRVISVEPADQAFIPSSAVLRIRFNQAMDRTSVQARLEIAPPMAGQVRWEGDTLVFVPREPWPEGERVTIRLAAGARSRLFLPMVRTQQWSYTVRRPRAAYLWPSEGPANLYARALERDEILTLTDETFGVSNFTVDYRRARIYYLATREDGGQDFKWLDLQGGQVGQLYACPVGSRCRDLQLDPAGRWLAFERVALIPAGDGQWTEGESGVWILDLENPQSALQVSPQDQDADQPRWSARGLLAFYNRSREAIWVIQPGEVPVSAPLASTASRLGVMGQWSPDGAFLLFPEIAFLPGENFGPGEDAPSFFSHLIRWSVDSGLREDLSGGEAGLVEDSAPVYAPQGGWVAFARRSLRAGEWTQGRQLWLMRTDGSEAHPVTADARFHHLAFAWKNDGRTLLYLRTDRQDLAAPPEIWLYDLETQERKRIAIGGFEPRWIP
jgi:hypothetical protein